MRTPAAPNAVTTVDKRPCFERALCHGLQQGLIDAARFDKLKTEGAKAIVQLATYFDTAHQRPALEAARTRLVTLVSLSLDAESGGNLEAAARLLRERSLQALSKAGADRLRALLKLPTDLLLFPGASLEQPERIQLSKWTLDEPMSFARYLAERRRRESNQATLELAYTLAGHFGVSRDTVQEWHTSCESVFNSVLLSLYAEKTPQGFFSGERFIALHAAARRKRSKTFALAETWKEALPPAQQRLFEHACEHFLSRVLPILKTRDAAEILREQERYSGLFCIAASDLDELTHHDRATGQQWHKLTGGLGAHPDVQCTVLLMVAAGLEPAPSLRRKDAVLIWQHHQQSGFDEAAVERFIETLVPFEYQSDIRHLWQHDLGPEARHHLDDAQERALAYLHETCRAGWKKAAR